MNERKVTLVLELTTDEPLATLRKTRSVDLYNAAGGVLIDMVDVEQATASVVQPVKPAKGGKP